MANWKPDELQKLSDWLDNNPGSPITIAVLEQLAQQLPDGPKRRKKRRKEEAT